MEGLLSTRTDQVAGKPKVRVTPALAEFYNVSADRKTYRFVLRSGVKWSDGVPLKAKDFVYSWKRLLSPLTASSYAYLLYDIQGAQDYHAGKLSDFNKVGVRALSDTQLEVQLREPIQHWPYIVTFWPTFPVREDIVKKYGAGWASPGRMVTLGPYRLASRDNGSQVVLTSNPLYHRVKGNIKKVVAKVIEDDSVAFQAYERGELDFFSGVSGITLKVLRQRADFRVFPYFKTSYLGFKTDKYPVNRPEFRRAIAQAINKKNIENALGGAPRPATSFVPPGISGSSSSIGLPFSVDNAKKSLASSGFHSDMALPLEFIVPDREKEKKLARWIQSEVLSHLGLKINIRALKNKNFRAQLDIGSHDLFYGTWGADFPDMDNFLSVFLSDSGNNRTQWKSAQYDQAVLYARRTGNQRLRIKKAVEAQRILLNQESVIVPLYYEPNLALVKSWVKKIELNPLNYLMLRKVSIVRK